jgi:hypothetical protein
VRRIYRSSNGGIIHRNPNAVLGFAACIRTSKLSLNTFGMMSIASNQPCVIEKKYVQVPVWYYK